MTPLTQEWVDKAEGDWNVVNREMRARNSPVYFAACFHAQQCAEKYLKAYLQETGIVFPLTHNLSSLLDLTLNAVPEWDTLRPALRQLAVYAVAFRYPGHTADRDEAKEARKLCALVRQTVRPSLGLPV